MTVREWGCPKCKSSTSRVIDTGRDDEGYIVRMRACSDCGGRWATEEVPIATEAYRGRATSRHLSELEWRHQQPRTCGTCGHTYRYGSWETHRKGGWHRRVVSRRMKERYIADRDAGRKAFWAREYRQRRAA